jgi:hypothetical protein
LFGCAVRVVRILRMVFLRKRGLAYNS